MSLFDRLKPQHGPVNNTANPVFDLFGSFQRFQNEFGQFAQNIYQQGNNPQQMVQELLDSGKMSREQFQQFSQMADALTGKRHF